MTDLAVSPTAAVTDDDDRPPPVTRRFTPTEGVDGFAHYLEMRRQQLISELRLIEDLLGLPPTFPRRVR